jgi:chemotaxis protein MotB
MTEDADVKDAMASVHGTWRLWLLLAATLGVGGVGMEHLHSQRDAVLGELQQADAKVTAKQAELATVEGSKAELEAKITKLEAENKELHPYKEQAEADAKAKEEKAASLKAWKEQLEGALKTELGKGQLGLSIADDKIVLLLPDKQLFDASDAAVSKAGVELLGHLGPLIAAGKPVRLEIGAHTDNAALPEKLKAQYPTVWELSAARAVAVTRAINESAKLEPKALAAVGYGPNRPLGPNTSAALRAKNRRVELTIALN